MADRIKLLPEIVANQIAAGEVVEEPASVVKEMMENAIDAGARTVKVNYRGGGLELIQIVDDGCGMSPIDARMAFDRHATSKISAAEDLYALHTFGFRGEALASIAAVSQVELRTRQAEDELGTVTEIKGGHITRQEPVACPTGSQFFVRNLFYNVPARRRDYENHLSLAASHIKNEFQRVAFCYPKCAFELYANDAPLFLLPAASLAGRIVDLVGKHIKQNLLEVDADTSIASVKGYVGRPAAAKRRNSEQYLFINGRYFVSTYLASAILKSYEKLIPDNVQPSWFLYLTVDPARIDVNIHPQKTKVRFADEQAVWQIVNAAVRETLAKSGAVAMMDFERQNVEIPVPQRGVIYKEPAAASESDYNPFNEEYIDPTATNPTVDFTGFDVPYTDPESPSSAPAPSRERARSGRAPRSQVLQNMTLADNDFDEFVSGSAGYEEFPSGAAAESRLDFRPAADAEQQQLDLKGEVRFGEAISAGSGLLLTTLCGKAVVVDLRRAQERVLYDRWYRTTGHEACVSQQLLFPERLVFSTEEYALLEEHAVEFAALGFDLDFCGKETVEVKGTPAELPAEAVDRLIYELLQTFASPVSTIEMRRDRIASLLARAGARNAPRTLDREAAARLLEALAASDNFTFSPSGKAIFAEITPEDLRARLG